MGLSFLYEKPAPDFPDKKLSVRFEAGLAPSSSPAAQFLFACA